MVTETSETSAIDSIAGLATGLVSNDASMLNELRHALSAQAPQVTAAWATEQLYAYRKLMGYYRCALMEV